ncbi:MAG: hypothetical protein K2X01_11700 [Cyanobacteria bacterium]|nr:hypothetical protein [Cyanobacteriota bacterium]
MSKSEPSSQAFHHLLITSVYPRSGKTTFTAGLSGLFRQHGLSLQAGIPFLYEANPYFEQHLNDVNWLQQTSRSQWDTIKKPKPTDLSRQEWQRGIQQINDAVLPCLIETPGTFSSPLAWWHAPEEASHFGPKVPTVIDILTNTPSKLLLVCPKTPTLIDQCAPLFELISSQKLPCLGWVSNTCTGQMLWPETEWPKTEDSTSSLAAFEVQARYLSLQWGLPWLGNLPWIAHLEAERNSPITLYKQLDQQIDTSAILQGMNVSIPTRIPLTLPMVSL